MALNIKDPETERLAAELAAQLHTSKTGAIRHALRAQLTVREVRQAERFSTAMEVLRTEIWPLTQGMAPLTKQDREDILGYDDHGLPA